LKKPIGWLVVPFLLGIIGISVLLILIDMLLDRLYTELLTILAWADE
jgi:hypothetical protein